MPCVAQHCVAGPVIHRPLRCNGVYVVWEAHQAFSLDGCDGLPSSVKVPCEILGLMGRTVDPVRPNLARWSHRRWRTWEVDGLGQLELGLSSSGMVHPLAGWLVFPNPWYGKVVGVKLRLGCADARWRDEKTE